MYDQKTTLQLDIEDILLTSIKQPDNKKTNMKLVEIKKLKLGIIIGQDYQVLMNPIDIEIKIELNSLLETNPFKLI